MTSPNPSEPLTGDQLYHDEALAPAVATKLLVASILTIYGVQIGLASAGLLPLAAAVIGDVVVLLLVVWSLRRRRARLTTVGLRRTTPRFVLAGVLVGLSAWYLNLVVVSLIEPPGDASGLERLVEQTPLVVTLVALAVFPAVVEETIFRGVFLRALATRVPALVAIVVSSLVFSLFHLLPAQMVSTFGLALALAFVTLRARSIVPAVIAHFLNNAIAIVVSRDEAGIGTLMAANPVPMLLGTAVTLLGGLALAARGSA